MIDFISKNCIIQINLIFEHSKYQTYCSAVIMFPSCLKRIDDIVYVIFWSSAFLNSKKDIYVAINLYCFLSPFKWTQNRCFDYYLICILYMRNYQKILFKFIFYANISLDFFIATSRSSLRNQKMFLQCRNSI